MAAKTIDLGLSALLPQKGQARGVDPQEAVSREPTAEDAVAAVRAAAGTAVGETQANAAPADPRALQTDAPAEMIGQGLSALISSMKPRHTVPRQNCQVMLPQPIAQALKMWATIEGIPQQQIMESAITAVVREWEARQSAKGREGD